MAFHIPFTFSSLDNLKKKSEKLSLKVKSSKQSNLYKYLEKSGVKINDSQYKAICMRAFLINFFILSILLSTVFLFLKINFILGVLTGLLFSFFLYSKQLTYPKLYLDKKRVDIEKNLIPALQDILVQLESGVALFDIMLNISTSNYGSVSQEFKKIVQSINLGKSQVESIEALIKDSKSDYLKRTLWQISNAIRSGSDLTSVIRENIKNLNQEQGIQIQSYGNKLNPIMMFYMLATLILPSLGVVFIILLSSIFGVSGQMLKYILIGVLAIVLLIQYTFLGIFRSRRPSLL